MQAALHLSGTPASPGLVRGPLHVLPETLPTRAREQVSPAAEESALRAALADAQAEITQLMSVTADADAKDILEFQVAMLEDESLLLPAFEAIARGTRADEAWRLTLDAQVADYRLGEDDYFRARASDLCDMRDRVLGRLAGISALPVPQGAIVIAADLPPSRFLEISWDGGGIALFEGSSNSHVATLARARGVPMIVGMTRANLSAHRDVLLDADNGVLIASPDAAAAAAFGVRRLEADGERVAERAALEPPAITAEGERIKVFLNVAARSELDAVEAAHCDGIGLLRTELMLRSMAEIADEERQFRAYRDILVWASGRPVTIRTLDAGGDKPIEGYTLPAEANPFLGMRGVRLSLLHPGILATQLRALARAAEFGPLKIMVPMVTQPWEFERVRALLQQAVRDLRASGVACREPELGMMVEVPAAALAIEDFEADFLSIGSNDLIQYLTACSRDSDRLRPLVNPLQAALLGLIRSVVAHARRRNIAVTLCGDMASDVKNLPALFETGLRSLSVAPAALGRVKAAIARYRGAPVD